MTYSVSAWGTTSSKRVRAMPKQKKASFGRHIQKNQQLRQCWGNTEECRKGACHVSPWALGEHLHGQMGYQLSWWDLHMQNMLLIWTCINFIINQKDSKWFMDLIYQSFFHCLLLAAIAALFNLFQGQLFNSKSESAGKCLSYSSSYFWLRHNHPSLWVSSTPGGALTQGKASL